MKFNLDRSYHKDVHRLNSDFLQFVKDSITRTRMSDGPVITEPMLDKCSPAVPVLFRVKSSEPLVACNVLQYKIIKQSNSYLRSAEPLDSRYKKILRNTLLFYREISRIDSHLCRSITGLDSESNFDEFRAYSYDEIDAKLKTNMFTLQLRFASSYWNNIDDIACDVPGHLHMITASLAAKEIIKKQHGG